MASKTPIPADETQRLAALHSMGEHLHMPSAQLDHLTRLAASVFDVPIAVVSLVDEKCQIFKSLYGLDVEGTARDVAFCTHAVMDDQIFVVQDAQRDRRFRDNPLVTGAPHIRFYAGRPLVHQEGYRLGTLCLIDRRPRRLSKAKLRMLDQFGDAVETVLFNKELLLLGARLTEANRTLQEECDRRQGVEQMLSVQIEKAAVALRAKSNFMALVSHELRTPLNSIMGFAELLESGMAGPLDERQARYCGHIATSGRKLIKQIDNILELSNIEVDKASMTLGLCAVDDLAQEVVKILSESVAEKSIDLCTVIPPGLPPLWGDASKIKQVLFAVLGNAVKYTPQGGRVCLKAQRHDAGGRGWLHLICSDSGPGIAPENRRRVFESFEQLDEVHTRSDTGTGLGLPLSQKIVRMHGGSIEAVDPEDGVGARFVIALPFNESGSSSSGPTAADSNGATDVETISQTEHSFSDTITRKQVAS